MAKNPSGGSRPQEKICEMCGKKFKIKNFKYTQRFCSLSCAGKFHSQIGHSQWRERVKKNCKYCGKEMILIPWQAKVKNFCSISCGAKYHGPPPPPKRGLENKQAIEREKRHNGIFVWHGEKKVMEHRLMMEKKIGRPLSKEEIVHHIDCDTYNNKLENLFLFPSSSKHLLAHGSVTKLVKPLLEKNIIKFNGKEGIYEYQNESAKCS